MLIIKRIYRNIKRNLLRYLFLLLWVYLIIHFSYNLKKANWPLLAIVTAIMIYVFKKYEDEEQRYDYIKNNIKLLYKEYVRNVDLAIIFGQKMSKEIKELSFSTYSTKYMNKVIEEDMIRDKNLIDKINNEINMLTWFNKAWLILAKEVLLGNKELKDRIKEYLEYNDKQIYENLTKTKDLIKKYFQNEFCEELN